MTKKLCIATLLLAFMLPVMAQTGNALRDTVIPQTYEYTVRGGRPLQMDVYLPTVPRPDSACVLYVFGGGFVTGSRTDALVRQYCQELAARGFTAIAIDYRLHLREINTDTIRLGNMQSIFRTAINIAATDVAAAVDYLYRHADEWGVSRDAIVLCGSSAGAISVLQVDYCRANGLRPAAELPPDWSPAAVVAYSGAIFADGSPKYAMPPAPTFFLHGKHDRIVHFRKFPPILRSGTYGPKRLRKVFARGDHPYWFFRYEDVGHEIASMHLYTLPEFIAFVDATLEGRLMRYEASCRDTRIVPTKWTKMNVFQLYQGKEK